MQINSEIQEWIRPDWKQEKLYPDLKKTSKRRWAWEFLRRNATYFQDYKRSLKMSKEDLEYKELCRKYLVLSLVHPNTEFDREPAPEDLEGILAGNLSKCVSFISMTPEMAGFTDYIVYEAQDGSVYKIPQDPPFERSLTASKRGEIVIKFDLERPLKQQLDDTKDRLHIWQDEFARIGKIVKPISPRPKRVLYAKYLRILDAKYCNAKWTELATTIYGNNSDDPKAMLKDSLEAANKLVNDGYKILLAV